MPHYMAELILTNRDVLLIGGGSVARRKLSGLLTCKANVLLVAPQLDPDIAQWVQQKKLRHLKAEFAPELLDHQPGYALVFATTSQAAINRQIAKQCAQRGLLCNSADDPKVSGFLVPAMVRRGPVTVGIGTRGTSPALARLLKERLDSWLEPGWGELAKMFGTMRQEVKERVNPIEKRQNFWRETALSVDKEERFKKTDNRKWFKKRLDEAGE
jgi:siroheme synthase-like protein